MRIMRLNIDRSQTFGFWEWPEFDAKKPADWNLDRILFSECNVADCDPHEGNQSWSYWETPFRLSRWINFSNYFLENLDYQVFVARNNIHGFSTESSAVSVRVSTEILIDKHKPWVVQNFPFEYWDISIMIAFSRIFGLWEFWRKTQNERFFKVVLFYRWDDSDWGLKDRIELFILGEKGVA